MRINTEKIRYLTLCKGITEKELLKAAGLNSDLLTVKRRLGGGITPTTAAKLASVLECEPAEIIGSSFSRVIFNIDNVRFLATCKGITENELLKKSKLSPCVLSKLRKSKGIPTPATIKKLASVLECEPADLLIYEEALPANNISEGVELCKE